MDFNFDEMQKGLLDQHERTRKYWEWIISEGPCEGPLDNIRSAVETLMKMEKEVLNSFSQGRPDLAQQAMTGATRMENRAYHLISHNLLQQILAGVKNLEANSPPHG